MIGAIEFLSYASLPVAIDYLVGILFHLSGGLLDWDDHCSSRNDSSWSFAISESNIILKHSLIIVVWYPNRYGDIIYTSNFSPNQKPYNFHSNLDVILL